VRALIGLLAITLALASHAGEKKDYQQPTIQPTGIAKPPITVAMGPVARFKWFEYTGHDTVFDQPAPAGTYRNPVLAGFYPDPSVTRAGDAYYLVNSTFAYFPGIPVFESRDLVHWRPIGNVIDRRQMSLDGKGVSRGIFAPTIRFHNGLFYVITTAVDAGGNELFVAKDPAGPWSDPISLPGLEGGIDPSLFFDRNGKAYVVNNGLPVGAPKYEGHRAIWIQELDLASRKLVGPRKVLINGGVDFSKHPIWIEGPHLYLHDGWYVLMCAEGGTSSQHSEVVLRARSPWGPFKPFAGNPILTQRDLPAERPDPITNSGHADLVEFSDGTWWAVFLASRPYEGVHYNTGRETFMLPVKWRDGWPTILPAGKAIPYIVEAPKVAATTTGATADAADVGVPGTRDDQLTPTTGNFTWRDDFSSPVLRQQWLYVRAPLVPWVDLTNRPGWLTIHALHVALQSLQNVSFLARRQQHLAFDASTELEAPGSAGGISAGLVAFQNEDYWYFLGVRRIPVPGRELGSRLEMFLEKRAGKQTQTVATATLDGAVARLKLQIVANARDYSFYFDQDGSGWKPLEEHADGSILSTDVAGGFVGAMVGPYARAD
jgi:xylan 1,4-beta-xylosidase